MGERRLERLASSRRPGETRAHIERLEPDVWVSQSEIAASANLTRSAISNYASGERGAGFPALKSPRHHRQPPVGLGRSLPLAPAPGHGQRGRGAGSRMGEGV